MKNLLNKKNNDGETFLSILIENENPGHNEELIYKLISSYLTFIDFNAELKSGTLSQKIENKFPNCIQKVVFNNLSNLYHESKNNLTFSNLSYDGIVFFQLEKKDVGKNLKDHIHDENESIDAPSIKPKFFSNEVLN